MSIPYQEKLEASGMSRTEAVAKRRLFERAAVSLRDLHPGSPEATIAFFVPGRIEVLGKHTDYAGGRSLLGAVERGFCLIAAPRRDRQIRVADAVSGSVVSAALDPDLPAVSGWGNYAGTVARRLARNFPDARQGADIAFESDLPPAAGMSSSSALITGIFLALSEINSVARSDVYRSEIHKPEDVAAYLGTMENGESFGALSGDRGVGTFGGSEDHTAILCCRAGRLSQYSFHPVRPERDVPVPDCHVFAVAGSGVAAEKSGGARDPYNRCALTARKILELWREATRRDDASLAAAASSEPAAPPRIRRILAESTDEAYPRRHLRDRFEHFLIESTIIVPGAAAALCSGDLGRFGRLADRSQRCAEDLLGNQIPETVWLARNARMLGAAASSAFGAGFGGSVWALIEEEGAEHFLQRWADRYRQSFPNAAARASFFVTRPGPSAVRI